MQLQNELYRIITATRVISPEIFLFAGKNFPGYPLVKTMTETLYQYCYCRRFNGNLREPKIEEDRQQTTDHQSVYGRPSSVAHRPLDNSAFIAGLSKANTSKDRWDKGWSIDQIMQGGQFLALKDGQYKFISPGEFTNVEYMPGMPREGSRVNVHFPKESFSYQPAFYFVFSNENTDQQHLFTMMRFYWNIKPAGAAILTGAITKHLNKYSIPFVFKILNNPATYTRSDAAVLYINKQYYHIVSEILPDIYEEVSSELNDEVPLFTKELGAGLAIAEDPGNGESFGMSRCHVLAQGIYNAYENSSTSVEEVMQYVNKTFEAKGIQIDKPYLNNKSIDIYEQLLQPVS